MAPTPRRILIVDDSKDTRSMLRMQLELDNHEVTEAGNGLDAIKAMLQHRYDVALVDLVLPDISGYDVARKIRTVSAGQAVSLIALTGSGLYRDLDDALEAGFDAYVLKPVSAHALAALLADPPRRVFSAGAARTV